MIAAWALLALAAQEGIPRTLEFPEPDSSEIRLQAVIRLPELQSQELAAARMVARTLLEGSGMYAKHQIVSYGSQTGEPPVVELRPDHLWIRLVFPKGQLSTATSMLASLLKGPSIPEHAFARELGNISKLPSSTWEAALWPAIPDGSRLKLVDALEFIARYVRPENTIVAFGGAIEPGEVAREWTPRIEGWNPQKPRLMPLQSGPPDSLKRHARGVSTYELALPPADPKSDVFAARLLSVYALGVGKGSLLFRVLREVNGWSYRQEAFLWPTPAGFQPRILWASSLPSEQVSAQKGRDALLAGVQTWTDQDRARALGLAGAALVRGQGRIPVYFSLEGPSGSGQEGREYFEAYWLAKTGLRWKPEGVCAEMGKVTLEELKHSTAEMLKVAFPRVIPRR